MPAPELDKLKHCWNNSLRRALGVPGQVRANRRGTRLSGSLFAWKTRGDFLKGNRRFATRSVGSTVARCIRTSAGSRKRRGILYEGKSARCSGSGLPFIAADGTVRYEDWAARLFAQNVRKAPVPSATAGESCPLHFIRRAGFS